LKKFEPIAIIGQGCVLPGCFSPEDLWQMVLNNKVNITEASTGSWRVDMNEVITAKGEIAAKNKAWNSLGGYVTGFDAHFDSASFEIESDIINGLDPVFKWSFYAAQAALKDSGYAESTQKERTGLIMGNLSYPSKSFSKYFEEKQLESIFPKWKNPEKPTNAVNRFMSGLPAILTAKALGLKGDTFAIDAACASSLYALKLGCDKLQSGSEDMMLIGGICASDQLFLHVGFTALNALSPSGQSRPFNRAADGLIPSEGSGFIVIKRLKDAIKSKDKILGVVRGIGLSNDGKQGGFLSPAQSGQMTSMRKALAVSGIRPEEVSYVECHATGTSTGDSIEIKSMKEVYAAAKAMHLSSLKGNIGHSITASGVGSIIKVLASFKHKILPPVPNAFPLNDSLADTIFSISDSPKEWKSKENRIAAISNFGFGGNNAHVILEEWNPKTNYSIQKTDQKEIKVAVVGLEILTEKFPDANAYLNCLLGNENSIGIKETIDFDLKKLSSPPNDLKFTLSQQLLILRVTQNLLEKNVRLDKERTGVFIGMGADAEINRYGFRKRLKELLEKGEIPGSEYNLNELEEAISPILNSAAVLGTMPNIPANRINNHFDFCGTGFTISCEELSGVKAFNIAIQAILNEERTSALVGAVDVSNEPVHLAALKEVLGITLPASDTALVVALKNYDQAVKDGDTILATINSEEKRKDVYIYDKTLVLSKTGYSHACSGLLDIAASILFTRNRLQLNEDNTSLKPILENNNGFSYQVNCSSLFGGENNFSINSEPVENIKMRSVGSLLIHCFSGKDKQSLINDIKSNTYSGNGNYKLGIISSKENLQKHKEQALQILQGNSDRTGWIAPNIHYRVEKICGEIAFVFTGAASAYPNMGKGLIQEFPALVASLQPYCNHPGFAGNWIYEANSANAKLPFYQLAGSSLMCQVHAGFTKSILGLHPHAAIGLSSGETNSMYALGVWDDMDALFQEINKSDLYTSALGVDFNAVKKHWKLKENEKVEWENWRVLAPVHEVEKLVQKENRVYLTIVNTKNDCVIGGDKSACDRIIQVIGASKAMPLNHDIAVHCAPVTPFEKTWRKLHTRKVNEVKGIRFYSNYLDGVYNPTSETVADALTGQALHTIDFPKIIEKAYADGVRVFIEHGPRNSLSIAINEILKDKEFVCVSLDKFGQSGLLEALRASTELWCAGVPVNFENLSAKNNADAIQPVMEIKFPMHAPAITNKTALPESISKEAMPIYSSNNSIYVMEKAPQISVAKRNTRVTTIENKATDPKEASFSEPQASLVFHQKEMHYDTSNGTNTSAQGIIDLLKNQHSVISEVHEDFLKTQLEGQQRFNGMMQNMLQKLVNSDFDESVINEAVIQNDALYEIGENSAPADSPVYIAPQKELTNNIENTIVDSSFVEETESAEALPGPRFSREELEVLSSGKISSVLGSLFERQDQYAIQVRMPEPPLLLCDRVTGIKGIPGSLGLGTIWTETDVTDASWYLHNNRMPPGIFIEAGQADLLLISYLGIDFQNKGERAYRLLGCELVFNGELPKPGDTLKYDIHVDGYAKSGETTLFFFHYDCHINGKLRISVRNGQAGFFSKQELEESKGVIWNPETAKYAANSVTDFKNSTKKKAFTPNEIEAYTKGDMVKCFGNELDWTQTHTRSPRSQGGYQNFIKNVTEFDLKGGPAKRGYLKSETIISPDDWYFKGHFKNDECMPGTLMADACLQMMAFYMVGAGLTVLKDGWRFEPVANEKYKFVCRGQVTPLSKKVIYEVFVDEIIDGDCPVLFAHVLTTVDGNKAFLCERLGLKLVPDWPLSTMSDLIKADVAGKKIASKNGFKFGYESLLNCSIGRPADAFGKDFLHYDAGARSPRLPGIPYHFMTRVAEYEIDKHNLKNTSYVIAEYDIPKDAWYFAENSSSTMPYAVLMEVALQPCGWLSTFLCQDDIKGLDLVFRNLDGKAVQHRKVLLEDETIITKTTLKGLSKMSDIIIVKFDVVSTINDEPVFTMDTVFGFFDSASMKTQKGLAISPGEQLNVSQKSNCKIDLTTFPKKYFTASTARLPESKLLMIDRIVAFYPEGGKHGRGYVKSEKDVEKNEWFFKAHFFQDPVQPGSLGVEAMIQLMQFYMLDQGLHKKFKKPVFEPVAIMNETEWHYRGQVTPDKKLISVDFEVKEVKEEKNKITVIGEARLWVDGLKIYHAPNIGMRIVELK
jgi:acyl transferase domain-containing protein/3-hydroxymyristoyl/3-hydroxydecanoyl-(acyl carrier protein) dehydratase